MRLIVCVFFFQGLDMNSLERLAQVGNRAAKISRRDLPAALSKGLSGGTTVSATMVACNRAGIQVFATGGIGGVHRGGESTLDISPDVMELGRSPITVVSSGIKSILDIGRTLEVLETEGVCVAAFGESQEFPAFFAVRSGHQAPWRVADAAEAASLIESRNALHLDSGVLIAVPIQKEFEVDGNVVEEAIQLALREAEAADLTGNAVTPFILQKLTERTAGATLRANVALIKNNAGVAADIASALSKIEREDKQRSLFRPSIPRQPSPPVVIGGSVADIVVNCMEDMLQLNGTTHAGRIRTSWGGVGRNVADCLTRLLGGTVRLVSAVGVDRHGEALLQHNRLLDTSGVVRVEGARTASYCTVLDDRGDCLFGVGDMDAHRHISPELIGQNEEHIACAPVVVIDGNLPDESISYVLHLCGQRQVPGE
nr:pseudouridine-5'-phosphate glycosidase-like [Dermacentor andersoni]